MYLNFSAFLKAESRCIEVKQCLISDSLNVHLALTSLPREANKQIPLGKNVMQNSNKMEKIFTNVLFFLK